MTTFSHARIMQRLVGVPLMAHPRKALIFYNTLCGRFGTTPADIPEPTDQVSRAVDSLRARPDASRFVGQQPESPEGRGYEPFRLDGPTAVITITGALINRGAYVGSYSGETSYEGIKFQLARAAANPRVKNVILDIESPGGEATGAFEAAQAVRQLAERKRTVAVVNSMAASAGYAIASGATQIVTTPTGIVGSIGVVLLHLDYSAQLAEEGIKPTLIFAGAHKVDGNYLQPLAESVANDLRLEVNRFYQLFLETVAAGRGRRTPETVARDTEARTYIGKDAVDARLADDVGTFEEVLASLKARAARQSGGSSSSRKAAKMDERQNDDLVLKADADRERAAAFGKGKAEGLAEGTTAGSKAAYARMAAILADEGVKGREAFALELAVDSPDMSAETVIKHAKKASPAPAEKPPGPASIAERAAESKANQVSGTPTPAERAASEKSSSRMSSTDEPSVKQPGSGWAEASAAANRTALSQRAKQRRRA